MASTLSLVSSSPGTATSIVLGPCATLDESGTVSVSSDVTITLAAPCVTVAPAIGGDPYVGGRLIVTTGTWTGNPTSYTYLWERSPDNGGTWIVIGTATTSSLPVSADLEGQLIRALVTATNTAGAAQAVSNTVGPVAEPEPQLADTILGCGDYEIYIQSRGGGDVRAIFPWTSIQWTRTLDDTSQATVAADGTCGNPNGDILPWRDEISIIRDGQQVWVGPVYQPASNPNNLPSQMQIVARDITAWWDHRLIHNDLDYSTNPTDLAFILQAISEDAMNPDNSPGLYVTATPCGILGTPTMLATQHQIAGSQIRTLTNSGVDWTCLNRDVLMGGAVVPVDPIRPTFTDEHFVNVPTVTPDGSVQANGWIVRGSGSGVAGDTIYGAAQDNDAAMVYGLLESVETDSSIQDNTTAQSAAQSRLNLTAAPVTITNGVLDPTAPFPVNTLIPGALCYVSLSNTVIPVEGQFRLGDVSGSLTAGDNQIEQVVVNFQPVGTNPASN